MVLRTKNNAEWMLNHEEEVVYLVGDGISIDPSRPLKIIALKLHYYINWKNRKLVLNDRIYE